MPDETNPVTSVSLFADARPSGAETLMVWLQSGLLTGLAIAHLVTPAFFLGGQGFLVRDVVLQAQLTLFILALVWGGLRWPSWIALVVGGVLLFVEWHFVIPEDLWRYAYQTVVSPSGGLLLAVIGFRIARVRGAWSSAEARPAPFQVSIGQLLAVTTLAAIAFAGATWMRQIPPDWIGNAYTTYGLVTLLDGLGIAGLALIAAWATGVRGGLWLKLLLLISAAILFGGCQIYAFKMDDLWLFMALSSAVWIVIVAGSLGIWRVCGWHLVRGRG